MKPVKARRGKREPVLNSTSAELGGLADEGLAFLRVFLSSQLKVTSYFQRGSVHPWHGRWASPAAARAPCSAPCAGSTVPPAPHPSRMHPQGSRASLPLLCTPSPWAAMPACACLP